ncbi:unnamed protein product [Calypogeia fissa]
MGSLTPETLFTNVVLSTIEPLEKTTHVESIDPTDFDMAGLELYQPALLRRWVATSGDMQRKLLCNDEGVPFIEAYVDRNMDSVVRFSVEFQPVKELQGWEVTSLMQQMQPDGLPGAFVQVTRFKCGRLVVAVTFSHMLADGKSLFDFMIAWSDTPTSLEPTKQTRFWTTTGVRYSHQLQDLPHLQILQVRKPQ